VNSFANDYAFFKRLDAGIVGLSSSHGRQLFVCGRLRKPKPCALCGVELKVGDRVYRPITNGYNRMHRLCVACITDLEKTKE